MKRRSFMATMAITAICLTSLLPITSIVHAETDKSIYIGIENNRRPYTYLDAEHSAQGILVESVRTECEHLGITCHFEADNFNTLLDKLQALELGALLVIDSFIDPEIDELQLSSPLCVFKPVVLQRASSKTRTKPTDFQRTTIGLREGSLLHLYLLDEYNSLAQLSPYTLLENGVFDLISGRIDALFTDEAFYRDRVLDTSLSTLDPDHYLIPVPVAIPELPATSMRFALKKQDNALMNRLERSIKRKYKSSPPACVDLIKNADPSTTKTTP